MKHDPIAKKAHGLLVFTLFTLVILVAYLQVSAQGGPTLASSPMVRGKVLLQGNVMLAGNEQQHRVYPQGPRAAPWWVSWAPTGGSLDCKPPSMPS